MSSTEINNQIYDTLGDRWYEAYDDPVALLRAEAQVRNPWTIRQIETLYGSGSHRVLDIGCGAGFLSNNLAKMKHDVTGIDLSEESLQTARKYDETRSVQYLRMDAMKLEFANSTFDIVCAMDFLEHIDNPQAVIQEASRVLKPGGLFFFHTFNRNWLSYLIVIKGVEIFVKNTPPHLHVYNYFIKPSEAKHYCKNSGLEVLQIQGVRPVLRLKSFWDLLTRRTVSKNFKFKFCSNTWTGYSAISRKTSLTLINGKGLEQAFH